MRAHLLAGLAAVLLAPLAITGLHGQDEVGADTVLRIRAAPAELGDGWEVDSPEALGLHLTPLEALAGAVATGTYPRTTSVVIVKDGRLVFEEYYGEGGPDVLHDTRSAMKSVTAMAIGAALADGTLHALDAPAFGWLTHMAPFEHDVPLKWQITLEDLLGMSSALDCDDWTDDSPGNEENMYPRSEWARWAVDLPVRAEYERDAEGRGPFSYCTAGAFLLGRILERAAGEPVDRYIERRLLDPLGIEAREWPRSATGEVGTGGGLRLRSRDLAKLGALMLDGGRWRHRQILPAEWVEAMLTIRQPADRDQNYGYLYWQRDFPSPCGPLPAWYMSGNGGNVVVHVPDQELVVVVTRRHYDRPGMHAQTAELLMYHVFAALECVQDPWVEGDLTSEG